MKINKKWVSLIEFMFVIWFLLILTVAFVSIVKKSQERIENKDTAVESKQLFEENNKIYEEALNNYINNTSSKDWNEEKELQEAFKTFSKIKEIELKGINDIDFMLEYLWIIEKWDTYERRYERVFNYRESTCMIWRDNYSLRKQFIENHSLFIEFINLLEKRDFKIKWKAINERTVKNLIKAKELIERNIESFNKELCSKEYRDEIKSNLEITDKWKNTNFLDKVENKELIELKNKLDKLLWEEVDKQKQDA